MSHSNVRGNMSPPVHHVALVFGPSQYGKSTFINTLLEYSPIKGQELAGVGSGNGESITLKVKSYDIGIISAMFQNLRVGYDTFQLIDVPGILDSGLRITKEEIFAKIKRILLKKGIQQIDAILVFESMKDDARKIGISMEALIKVFGEKVKESILVLTTKWDRVEEEEHERLINYLEKLINPHRIKYIKWQNNIKVRGRPLLTEEEVMNQISMLGTYIQKCKPYCVKEMESLLVKRQQLAEKLRENDPNRYVTDSTEIEVDVPESYTEVMNLPCTEFIEYTDSEIEVLAKKMQATDTGESITVFKPIEYKEKTFLPRTEYKEKRSGLFGWSTKLVPKTYYEEKEITKTQIVPETKKVPRDFNYFKQFYIGQGKAVNRDREIPIEKVRYKKTKKIIPSQHERHEFDYYLNLATQELDEEIRNSIRNSIV